MRTEEPRSTSHQHPFAKIHRIPHKLQTQPTALSPAGRKATARACDPGTCATDRLGQTHRIPLSWQDKPDRIWPLKRWDSPAGLPSAFRTQRLFFNNTKKQPHCQRLFWPRLKLGCLTPRRVRRAQNHGWLSCDCVKLAPGIGFCGVNRVRPRSSGVTAGQRSTARGINAAASSF